MNSNVIKAKLSELGEDHQQNAASIPISREGSTFPESGIYTGTVGHCRYWPRHHDFEYRVFMMFLDLQKTEQLFSATRLWSSSRWSLAWLRRSDFIAPHSISIVDAVKKRILEETGAAFDGKVYMLANLRYFGFIMNPLVCYYCYDNDAKLRYIVAEVTNTPWRERHSYVLNCDPNKSTQRINFGKQMHVSPFNPMQMNYQWRSSNPGENLNIAIDAWCDGRKNFTGVLTLRHQVVTAATLRKTILRYPFMTAKVCLAIYWQALKLFVKRIPFVPHPKSVSS